MVLVLPFLKALGGADLDYISFLINSMMMRHFIILTMDCGDLISSIVVQVCTDEIFFAHEYCKKLISIYFIEHCLVTF